MVRNMVALTLQWNRNWIFWIYKTVFVLKLMYLGVFKLKLLYSKFIQTNCVFLTVFPNIEDPSDPSFSFFHTFPVFSAIEVLLYWTFRVYEKDFFLYFCCIFWDPLAAKFSSWVLLRVSTKFTNWKLPKFNIRTGFSVVVGFIFSSQPCRTL